LVKDAALRAQLQNWKHYTTICPPAPSEFLALAALQVQDKLAARNRRLIEQNLATAAAFFARWSQLFQWRPPQAGSVALVGLNLPSATDYCHALAQNAGVLLLPSSYLGYGDQHVRLGLGRADFASNLAVYEKYLLNATG
ncbi:MAG: aspartate/tyrosine/aromatic aminotransferase, partial [Anaerolineae bacterium]